MVRRPFFCLNHRETGEYDLGFLDLKGESEDHALRQFITNSTNQDRVRHKASNPRVTSDLPPLQSARPSFNKPSFQGNADGHA